VQQNDIPAAEKLIAEVLAKSPRDNDALVLRGNLALANRNPKAAIADLRSVLRDQPNAVGVMRSLARAHLANGEPAMAEETMRRAVESNPKDPDARLDLAQLLIQLGKPAQAAPVIDQLVQQQPNNVRALEAQFKIAMAGNDKTTAKSAADAIVVLQPKSPLGYYFQGNLAETDKRLDDALRLYGKAFDLQPDAAEPLEAFARALVLEKRVPEALQRLDGLIAQYPKVAEAPNLKGEVLLSQQRYNEAAPAFKLAIEREPKWWRPYRNLAVIAVQGHDDTGAVTLLQDGISKVSDRTALEAQLASVYERTGKPDEAMGVYEAELRRNPASDVAANNLAMLLVTYKKDPASLDRARELAARFSNSTNGSFLDTYGWVLYKRGEGPAAVAALKTALTKGPESPVSLYHLGMAQALTGESVAARDSLMRSLQSGQRFSGMDEARATLDKLAKLDPTSALQPRS
jgi:tetratricopeptide (TPR) repeat protein